MLRAVLIGFALVLGATQASAQITTYIAPPRPAAPTPDMVAAADSAQRDSLAQVAITNMKVWVDSAAGVFVPEHVGDSLAVDPGRPVTTTFAEGSVAPATASALPALALVGVVVFGIGVVLLTNRPRG